MTAMFPERIGQISVVQPGMRVIDSAGVDVGRVEFVKMGDPGAVTDQGQRVGEPHGVFESIVESLVGEEPDVPGTLGARLRRIGYIKINGRGLLDSDRYAAADQINRVDGETVDLSVTRDQLAVEL